MDSAGCRLDVLAEHGFDVTSSEDEHSVEALSPAGADESPRRWRSPVRPDRGLDDPDAPCGADGVEGSGELCVSVTDEEFDRAGSWALLHCYITRLRAPELRERALLRSLLRIALQTMRCPEQTRRALATMPVRTVQRCEETQPKSEQRALLRHRLPQGEPVAELLIWEGFWTWR